jgi:hypothetical protein
MNNAINERQKKKTKAPEKEKKRIPKVLRNSPKAPKGYGKPEREASPDTRPR